MGGSGFNRHSAGKWVRFQPALTRYASSFYLPAILAVPMARDLALPSWAIFAGLSAALLIAGALAPMAGRLVGAHGGRPLLPTSSLGYSPLAWHFLRLQPALGAWRLGGS